MRNITEFVDFVTEAAASEPIVWVVTINHGDYRQITSVHRQSEHSEALDVYYQNITNNYQRGDIDDCVAEWFENLDDDEKRQYNIPDDVEFDEAFDHIPPDVYQEVWRSCADDSSGVYDLVDIESIPMSYLFDIFVSYSEDRMEKEHRVYRDFKVFKELSEGPTGANIIDFIKEDIDECDMPHEIRAYLDSEISKFRRASKTKGLFGI